MCGLMCVCVCVVWKRTITYCLPSSSDRYIIQRFPATALWPPPLSPKLPFTTLLYHFMRAHKDHVIYYICPWSPFSPSRPQNIHSLIFGAYIYIYIHVRSKQLVKIYTPTHPMSHNIYIIPLDIRDIPHCFSPAKFLLYICSAYLLFTAYTPGGVSSSHYTARGYGPVPISDCLFPKPHHVGFRFQFRHISPLIVYSTHLLLYSVYCHH